MTSKELNYKIRNLKKRYIFLRSRKNTDAFFRWIEKEFRDEFRSIYFDDLQFERMSYKSMKILMRLNQKEHVIPFHMFGIHINLDEL